MKLKTILALITLTVTTHLQAQAWPNKPVRIVVAFPPGTPGDVTLRTISEKSVLVGGSRWWWTTSLVLEETLALKS